MLKLTYCARAVWKWLDEQCQLQAGSPSLQEIALAVHFSKGSVSRALDYLENHQIVRWRWLKNRRAARGLLGVSPFDGSAQMRSKVALTDEQKYEAGLIRSRQKSAKRFARFKELKRLKQLPEDLKYREWKTSKG